MANEILKDEILKDEQLDEVAGGAYSQSYNEMTALTKMGISFFPNDRDASVNKLGGLYQQAGIRFVAHNKENHPNEYYNAVTGEALNPNVAFQHLVNTINAYRASGGVVN